MDACIPYEDTYQAASARSMALRWLLDESVMDDGAVARQFDLSTDTIDAIRHGAPLLVGDDRARRIDRMVAAQSLLLDGYSPARMVKWFTSPQMALAGRLPQDMLMNEPDATSDVLEAAAAWMA